MNGKTVKLLTQRILAVILPSPLIFDLNNDGFDEVLVLINLRQYLKILKSGSMKSA